MHAILTLRLPLTNGCWAVPTDLKRAPSALSIWESDRPLPGYEEAEKLIKTWAPSQNTQNVCAFDFTA